MPLLALKGLQNPALYLTKKPATNEIAPHSSWLPPFQDGMPVKVAYHGETAVQASLPSQVRCTVVDAAATFKGERKTASTKMVTLDTGARIQVPGFIEQGEDVLVKTSDQTFVAR
jgi:hypothetical protein